MKRFLRFALIGAGALVLVLAIVAVVAVSVINPNDYKPQIEAAVHNATGKQLALQGELSLSLFPGLSIEAGPAELTDDASFGSEPFLRVEKVSASVAVLPLLSGTVNIGDVSVSGVRLKLAVNKDGKPNWVMAGTPPKPAPEPKTPQQPANAPKSADKKSGDLSSMALKSLTITDTLLVYTDMRSKDSTKVSINELVLGPVKVGEKTGLNLKASYTGAMARPVTLVLDASFTLPASFTENTSFTAKGKLDETTFSCNGVAGLPNGKEIYLKGDITLGDISIDKYTAAPAKTKQAPAAKQPANQTGSAKPAAASEDTATAELLRSLFLDLHITAKSVTAANIPISQIKATIKADQGLINAKPVSMVIAEAPLNLEASIDARGNTPKTRLIGDWKGAKIGQVIKATAGKENLSGTLNTDWSINAAGFAWPAAAKTLGGKFALALTDGTVPAFQIIPGGVPGLPATTLDLTNVRCTSTWNITSGIAKNDDLVLKAAALAATGAGQINIPAQTINYKATVELPTLKQLPNLTILPLVIAGPLASPSYGVDQPELLRQGAKTILDPAAKGGEKLENLGKGLGEVFKGLKK
ncbi:AsmA family protein [Desulfovibrio sp. OttesenSCG-928-O18]|nr:AsmA family protein [Desulfovibrio sp. OttesenSCG-928-O18]